MTNTVYRVHLLESERGWGMNRWHEDYATMTEAKVRIEEVNKKNVSESAPNYYMIAEEDVMVLEVSGECNVLLR